LHSRWQLCNLFLGGTGFQPVATDNCHRQDACDTNRSRSWEDAHSFGRAEDGNGQGRLDKRGRLSLRWPASAGRPAQR
jgi:hypothetical protein